MAEKFPLSAASHDLGNSRLLNTIFGKPSQSRGFVLFFVFLLILLGQDECNHCQGFS